MNDNQVMAVMIVVAMLLIVVIAVVKIRRRMRRFLNSAEVCLVRELVRSAQNGELQQEEQPKSLGGMTSIYLPQILRDFPEFNWEELRAEVEQSVKELLETKNVRSAGVVRIHKTVISRYQKYNGTASILCETAAEYWTKAENQENSQTTARNVRQSAKGQHGQNDAAQQTRKKQTVCEAELIYVYNFQSFRNCRFPGVSKLRSSSGGAWCEKVPLLWVCSGGVRGKIMESPECPGAELRIV